jgi:hypothetical protein
MVIMVSDIFMQGHWIRSVAPFFYSKTKNPRSREFFNCFLLRLYESGFEESDIRAVFLHCAHALS